jgi:hypothetical protein
MQFNLKKVINSKPLKANYYFILLLQIFDFLLSAIRD